MSVVLIMILCLKDQSCHTCRLHTLNNISHKWPSHNKYWPSHNQYWLSHNPLVTVKFDQSSLHRNSKPKHSPTITSWSILWRLPRSPHLWNSGFRSECMQNVWVNMLPAVGPQWRVRSRLELQVKKSFVLSFQSGDKQSRKTGALCLTYTGLIFTSFPGGRKKHQLVLLLKFIYSLKDDCQINRLISHFIWRIWKYFHLNCMTGFSTL